MLAVGPVKLAYESFFVELINFVILVFVVFFVVKKLLKIEKA